MSRLLGCLQQEGALWADCGISLLCKSGRCTKRSALNLPTVGRRRNPFKKGLFPLQSVATIMIRYGVFSARLDKARRGTAQQDIPQGGSRLHEVPHACFIVHNAPSPLTFQVEAGARGLWLGPGRAVLLRPGAQPHQNGDACGDGGQGGWTVMLEII